MRGGGGGGKGRGRSWVPMSIVHQLTSEQITELQLTLPLSSSSVSGSASVAKNRIDKTYKISQVFNEEKQHW